MAPLSVVVLSEDGSRHAPRVWRLLLERLLVAVDPSTRRDRIEWGFPSIDLVRANRWKSDHRRDHRSLIELRQAIATWLARGAVVVFHVDGDRPWSERATSENVPKFDERIGRQVRSLLRQHVLPDLVDRHHARLQRVSPFYSVEAWLYQNTAKAVELCRTEHAGRDVETFLAWGADRTLLDEVIGAKDRTCLGSGNNEELARTLTNALVAEVRAADRSLAAAVRSLATCEDLVVGLRRTYETC